MALGKPRGKNGMIPVLVYDPKLQRKVHVGQCATKREALLLEAAKKVEFSRGNTHSRWTVAGWAQTWLAEEHGEGTPRPADSTYKHNELSLRRFISMYGGRKLHTITRAEAEAWGRVRPSETDVIAAMFADAHRKEYVPRNVFARLGVKKTKGRSEITALSEAEIDRLCEIALQVHGEYGPEFAALLQFAAWTGVRPGELCALEWSEVDVAEGVAHIWWSRRNTGQRHQTKTRRERTIVLGPQALGALAAVPKREGAVFRSKTGLELRQNSITGSAGLWTPVRTVFTAELPDTHWLKRRLRLKPTDALVPYELRHFCGSMLADRGLNARDISQHLGNTPAVCEVYIHDYKDRQQDRIRAALASDPVRKLNALGSKTG